MKLARTPRPPFHPDLYGSVAYGVPGLVLLWNSMQVFGCAGWFGSAAAVVLVRLLNRSASPYRKLREPARGIHVFTRIASACSRIGS